MTPEKATNGRITVVFVFVDEKKNSVLMERRDVKSFYHDKLIFPGGTVEPDEIDNWDITLIRECLEELGVVPRRFKRLAQEEKIISETGCLLVPYLIMAWEGQIPTRVADTHRTLEWISLEADCDWVRETIPASNARILNLAAASKNGNVAQY